MWEGKAVTEQPAPTPDDASNDADQDDDDDFGDDFDEFAEEAEDDDFGDFDEATPSAEAAPPSVPEPQSVSTQNILAGLVSSSLTNLMTFDPVHFVRTNVLEASHRLLIPNVRFRSRRHHHTLPRHDLPRHRTAAHKSTSSRHGEQLSIPLRALSFLVATIGISTTNAATELDPQQDPTTILGIPWSASRSR